MKSIITIFLITYLSLAHAGPAQIIIIRHAEKPDVGDDLSPEGYRHAEALVGYFTKNPDVLEFGPPIAIYAMAPKGDVDGSRRPIETVTPLARELGVHILSPYKRMELKPLADMILGNVSYNGKMVLICWEHKAIRGLLPELGVDQDPGKWLGTDFETVYRINYSPSGQVKSFDQFKQSF